MEQIVIIAGSGVSAAAPSNLPSWWEYNKMIIDQIKTEARKLCPDAEAALEHIDVEKGLPVQCISQLIVQQGAGESYFPLIEMLDGTVPNANHLALSELARSGKLKAIVTTNFDTLIERAFRQNGVPLFTAVQPDDYYESLQITACKLFKIHGTVHDTKSMIDTIYQKALGLSNEKRLLLDAIFSDCSIYVLGFSGADLDFDIDYLPLASALTGGSHLTWILRPGSKPNPNVLELQRLYPSKVTIQESELGDFFTSLGISYPVVTAPPAAAAVSNDRLKKRIESLFTAPHIGVHGCVGYCLSLLEMIGDYDALQELAEAYEKKLDWSALDILAVTGINSLAHCKMRSQDFAGAIRCYQAVLQCHEVMKSLREQTDSSEQNEKANREYYQNTAAAYQNLGNCCYYQTVIEHQSTLELAKLHFEEAEKRLQQIPNPPFQSLVSFQLARVRYLQDKDVDQYLTALSVSCEMAKKEGRMDTQAEILLTACSQRLRLGEYHLAAESIDICGKLLKNLGNHRLNNILRLCRDEYRIRKGEFGPLPDSVLDDFVRRVSDPIRKRIIQLEAAGQTASLPALFLKLCEQYTEKQAWQRLWDVAYCGYAAASTPKHQMDALYFLGCASAEQSRYADAESYWKQILSFGSGINDLKRGWSHSELSRLQIKRKNIVPALEHAESCLRCLLPLVQPDQTAAAVWCIVEELYRNGYSEEAERVCARFLETSESEKSVFQSNLTILRRQYSLRQIHNIETATPQELATDALALFDQGEKQKAWELMQKAREKYLEADDLVGVAHCENNIGSWYLAEKDYQNAIAHFKAAADLNFSLDRIGPGINNLSAVLQILTNCTENLEKAKEYVHYAEENLPRFVSVPERYLLFYALARYKLVTEDYAAALVYSRKAAEGISWINATTPGSAEILQAMIAGLEEMFHPAGSADDPSEFEKLCMEAARLGQIGQLTQCLNLLNKLECSRKLSPLQKGILDGTRANALLSAGKPKSAIPYFRSALKIFESAEVQDTEKQQTAINGLCIALGKMNRQQEAIQFLKKKLRENDLPTSGRIHLTCNLCNRMITYHASTLEENDSNFSEIIDLLGGLETNTNLSHEEAGGIYSCYGSLYAAVGNIATAKQYLLRARNSFLPVNSRYLADVERALNMLESNQ